MLRYFFSYESEIPPSMGWELFHWEHMAILLVLMITVFFCSSCYQGFCTKKQKSADHVCGLVLLSMEAVQDFYLFVSGHFTLGHLPLHLCGLALFFEAWHAFCKGDLLGQVVYSVCLPGAVCGLLFPDWSVYPMFNYMNLHGFFIHGLLVLYAVCQVRSGKIRPDIHYLLKVILFLACCAAPVYIINQFLHTNFMFLNWPSPGSPMVYFAEKFGNPGYLIPYILLIIGVIVMFYLPFAFYGIRKVRKSG